MSTNLSSFPVIWQLQDGVEKQSLIELAPESTVGDVKVAVRSLDADFTERALFSASVIHKGRPLPGNSCVLADCGVEPGDVLSVTGWQDSGEVDADEAYPVPNPEPGYIVEGDLKYAQSDDFEEQKRLRQSAIATRRMAAQISGYANVSVISSMQDLEDLLRTDATMAGDIQPSVPQVLTEGDAQNADGTGKAMLAARAEQASVAYQHPHPPVSGSRDIGKKKFKADNLLPKPDRFGEGAAAALPQGDWTVRIEGDGTDDVAALEAQALQEQAGGTPVFFRPPDMPGQRWCSAESIPKQVGQKKLSLGQFLHIASGARSPAEVQASSYEWQRMTAEMREARQPMGSWARVVGLCSEEGRALNGCAAQVRGWAQESGRFIVQVRGETATRRVRPANLVSQPTIAAACEAGLVSPDAIEEC